MSDKKGKLEVKSNKKVTPEEIRNKSAEEKENQKTLSDKELEEIRERARTMGSMQQNRNITSPEVTQEVENKPESPEEPEVEQSVDIEISGPDDVFSPNFSDIRSKDLPTIELTDPLPSKGLSYPEGHKVSYRPYVFGEVKKVSGSRTTFEELARTILEGIQTTFPIGDLTFYDFLYVSLLRKLSTIGDSTIIATHVCPNRACQVSNSYEISVGPEKCEVDFWDVDYDDLPVSVDLKLGDEGYTTYEFMPLTILDYLRLERMNLHKDSVAKLAMQCVNFPFEEVRPKLYRAYGEESQILTQLEDILHHGVKPINVKCPSCGSINLLQLDGGNVVIRPFRTDEEVASDRIRFGKKSKDKSNPPV